MLKAPLGFFDANASGLIRGRLDAAAADTETLLAHNLADIVGTITLFIAMLALMFLFDWRMGCACLLAAVISILSMFAMMGGKNAGFMAQRFLAGKIAVKRPGGDPRVFYNLAQGCAQKSLLQKFRQSGFLDIFKGCTCHLFHIKCIFQRN